MSKFHFSVKIKYIYFKYFNSNSNIIVKILIFINLYYSNYCITLLNKI